MESELEMYYKTAMDLTDEASKIVKLGFDSVKTIDTKMGPWDVVTEYDKKVEEFLIQSLSKIYPTHKFIGEETTENKSVLDNDPTWIIDPIDGTNNFAIGFPESAISIGLAVDKEIIVGIVCNPMRNMTFSACKGKGAFLNGKPIHPSKVTNIEEAVIGCEISIARIPFLRDTMMKTITGFASKARGVRSLGCAALSLCYVAAGMWDAYHVDFLYPWDYAGGSLIVEEAGGIVVDSKGEKFNVMNRSIVVAGTKELADQLVCITKDAAKK